MKHRLLSNHRHVMHGLLLILAASFSTSASALLVPSQDKLIGVRASTKNLTVDIEPIKNSFQVNEKIRLRSKGNQPYYLYLFNVNPQTGEAVMILPNKLQRNNYYSQQSYIVPNRDVEFYSDRPGVEQMIMVASRKSLKVDMGQYKSIGDFVTGKSAAFEKSLGVRFNAPAPAKVATDRVVKTFSIHVQGERITEQPSFFGSLLGAPASVDKNDPVAFIATAHNEYTGGEQFNIVFGANQKGYIHLYTIDPYGAYDFLKVVAVDGKSIQTLLIQAAPPYGKNTLVALFDKNKAIQNKSFAGISVNSDKSLFVVEQAKRTIAIQPVIIKAP